MKSYEIAYLLNPDLSAEDAVLFAGKITQAIEKSGGSATYVEEPKKRRLAYFIKKQGAAYFGFTKFNLDESALRALQRAVSEERNILRSLVVEALKANRNLQDRPFPRHLLGRKERPAGHVRQLHVVPERPRPEKPAEPVDIEAIDKKLDEILK